MRARARDKGHKGGEHKVEMMLACAEEYWLRYLLERKGAYDRAREKQLTSVVVFTGPAFAFTHLGIGDATTISGCNAYINKLFKGRYRMFRTGEDSEDVYLTNVFSNITDNFSCARGVHQGAEVFALRLPHKFRAASTQALSLLASAISIGLSPSGLCLLNAIFSPRPYAPPSFEPWSTSPLDMSMETIKRLGGGANLSSMVKSLRGASADFDTSVIPQDVNSQNLALLLLQLACEGYPLPDLKAIITGTHIATAPENEAMFRRALMLAICNGERGAKFECVKLVPKLREGRQVWGGKRNGAVVHALKEDEEYDALKLLEFANSLLAVDNTLASVARSEMEKTLDRSIQIWQKRVAISSSRASSNGGGGSSTESRRKSSRRATASKSAATSEAASATESARAQRLEGQRIPAEDWDLNYDLAKKTLLAYFKLSASFRWEKWVKCEEGGLCKLCTVPAQEHSGGGGGAAAAAVDT